MMLEEEEPVRAVKKRRWTNHI